MSKSGKPRKEFIFLFTGEEFLRRNKIESLLEELIPASNRSTNLVRIHADDLDWAAVLNQARTPSLLGGDQAFWISACNELKKKEFEIFEEYADEPASGTYFIFEADELGEIHPLVKLAGQFGKHVRLAEQGREESFNVFRMKLKRLGKTLTPEAWRLLEERLGASPVLMSNALDQLVLYSQSSTIDEIQVQALATEFLRYEPFDLTEALASRNGFLALKIFHFFYEMAGEMTSVVGLIHWQLKRIWQAKRLLANGSRPDEIGRALRIPPFRLQSFLAQAKRFDMEMVEKLLESLWQIDWNSKKGRGEEAVAMEAFLAGVSS